MAKVSIITISYNSENTISETLKSIKSQSFKDFEHIIIDGGSTDKTISIIEKANISNKVISEKDKGIYDAFNKGIINSKGDIIGFLNSDDTFYSKNSLKEIEESFNENIDCVFGNLVYTNSRNKITRIWKGSRFLKDSFKKSWMPAHPTFYCKRNIYHKYGFYDESFRIAGDFDLMMRFLEKHNVSSRYINNTLVKMRSGGISNRSLMDKLHIIEEEFKAFKNNNIKVNKIYYLFQKAKKIKEFKFI